MSAARREQGIVEVTSRRGHLTTHRTITCVHCNTVTILEQAARAEDCGGFCRQCMAPTCKLCADKGCTPFERELERMEARGRLFASMGI